MPSLYSAELGTDLAAGSWVRIEGLQSRADLNDQLARVVDYRATTSSGPRWIVRVAGASLLVKPSNLRATIIPRALVDATLHADEPRKAVFDFLFPVDVAAAAVACKSFRDQSQGSRAARPGWSRLPLAFEQTVDGSWADPPPEGLPYGNGIGEIDTPMAIAPLPASATLGGAHRGYAVVTGGTVQVFSADGDPAFRATYAIYDPDKPPEDDGIDHSVFVDPIMSIASTGNSLLVVGTPDDGLVRVSMPDRVIGQSLDQFGCEMVACNGPDQGNLVYCVHYDDEGEGTVCSVSTAEHLLGLIGRVPKFGPFSRHGKPDGLAARGTYLAATDLGANKLLRWRYVRDDTRTPPIRWQRLKALPRDNFQGGPCGIAMQDELMIVTFVYAHCIRVFSSLGARLLQTITMPGSYPISVCMDEERVVVGAPGVLLPHISNPGHYGGLRHDGRLYFFKWRAPAGDDAETMAASD